MGLQSVGRHASGMQMSMSPPPSAGAQQVAPPPPQSALVLQLPISRQKPGGLEPWSRLQVRPLAHSLPPCVHAAPMPLELAVCAPHAPASGFVG